MNYPLRPYQRQAIDITLSKIKEGEKRILLALPVGTGKTTVLTQLLLEYLNTEKVRKQTRVLIIYRSIELVKQTIKRLQESFGNDLIANESGSIKDTPIVVTTLHRALSKLNNSSTEENQFDIIVFDEAESSGIGKNNNQVNNLLKSYSSTTIIGFDIFPQRSLSFFGKPVFTYSIPKAIKEGFLVPVVISREKLSLPNLGSLTILDQVEGTNNLIEQSAEEFQLLAKSVISKINKEKTIIICPSQAYAQSLSFAINEQVNNIEYSYPVIASLERNIVNEVLEKFRKNKLPLIVTSVDKLSTGVELPNVKNIVLLRKVISLEYLQRVLSIGMRTYKNKESLHVIDYAENEIEAILNISNDTPIIEGLDNEEIKKKTFTKTEILFRDRSSINGVLGVKDLAFELADIIKKIPNEQGTMIGIFGRWGRGKTFLMDETWHCLQELGNFERVNFHAWKYQDTPASWAYLYENLSDKYIRGNYKRSIYNRLTRHWRILKLNIKRNHYGQILGFLASILILIISVYLFDAVKPENSTTFESVVKYFGISITAAVAIYKIFTSVKKEYSTKAKDFFLKYSQKYSFKQHLGLQAEIQKEIHTLVKTWIKNNSHGKKVILFIDDIDRCKEEKIIEIIDSLRVMLEDEEVSKRVVVIAAIDENVLKRAIKSKYRASVLADNNPDLKEQTLTTLTKEYIDKLFMVGIKLGPLSYQERDEFFMEFIKTDIEKIDTYITNQEDSSSKIIDVASTTEMEESTTNNNLDTEDYNIHHEGAFYKSFNRSEKLTQEEVTLLREGLKKFHEATPRQIRIFYYRYLLTKNLLIKKYVSLGRENIWLKPDYTRSLIDLIINYSSYNKAIEISEHKINVLQTDAPNVRIFGIENSSIDAKDYGELLKVLDIVIAY